MQSAGTLGGCTGCQCEQWCDAAAKQGCLHAGLCAQVVDVFFEMVQGVNVSELARRPLTSCRQRGGCVAWSGGGHARSVAKPSSVLRACGDKMPWVGVQIGNDILGLVKCNPANKQRADELAHVCRLWTSRWLQGGCGSGGEPARNGARPSSFLRACAPSSEQTSVRMRSA